MERAEPIQLLAAWLIAKIGDCSSLRWSELEAGKESAEKVSQLPISAAEKIISSWEYFGLVRTEALPELSSCGRFHDYAIHIDCQPLALRRQVPRGLRWERLPSPVGLKVAAA